jgi:hypothetical protein
MLGLIRRDIVILEERRSEGKNREDLIKYRQSGDDDGDSDSEGQCWDSIAGV